MHYWEYTRRWSAPQAGQECKKPVNVVLINLDDSGYGDWSFKGAVGYQTPNVDYIANNGIHFTNYYSAQPISGASRSALMTGCYSNRVGLTMAPMNNSPYGLADEEETIGELLQANGYATALIGKWHIGDAEQFLPPHHGFDEWLGLPYSNDMWPNHPTMKFPRLPLYEGLEIQKYIDTDEDMSELTTMYKKGLLTSSPERQRKISHSSCILHMRCLTCRLPYQKNLQERVKPVFLEM